MRLAHYEILAIHPASPCLLGLGTPFSDTQLVELATATQMYSVRSTLESSIPFVSSILATVITQDCMALLRVLHIYSTASERGVQSLYLLFRGVMDISSLACVYCLFDKGLKGGDPGQL
jgi:hypothetical protein